MAQADLLVQLLKSASSGDQLAFRKAAEFLIQEEESKGHRILADRLAKSLQPARPSQPGAFAIGPGAAPKPNGNGSQHKHLICQTTPERALDSPVLPASIQAQIKEVVEEQHRAELLHAHNLRARNRLFSPARPAMAKPRWQRRWPLN